MQGEKGGVGGKTGKLSLEHGASVGHLRLTVSGGSRAAALHERRGDAGGRSSPELLGVGLQTGQQSACADFYQGAREGQEQDLVAQRNSEA